MKLKFVNSVTQIFSGYTGLKSFLLIRALLFFVVYFGFHATLLATIPLTSLERLRVTETASRVRFVFDANHPIQYKKQRLSNPDRLVLDIKQAKISGNLNFPRSADNPVNRIKATEQADHSLQLTLDLKFYTDINTFTLKPAYGRPYRLVIDFSNKKPTLPTKIIEPVTVKRNIIIVIDPGHGGKDPGALGPGRTKEKNVTLAISKKLEDKINQQPGFHAVLTRNRDIYISLRQRLAIARRYKADMFVAIHADAYRDHSARGASVYALSSRGATSEAARWLAKRENDSELMGGVNLSDKGNILKSVLLNLSQTATIRASLMIGSQLIQFLNRIAYLHHHRVEQAAFVVLKSPDIPSLLVETGFLSNHYEERRLINSSYQDRLALAISKGITAYFIHNPPPNTWLAYWRDHPEKYAKYGHS